MFKMMNYNELKKVAESKRILISEVAEAVGMTSTGFKRSIEIASFPVGKVCDLCDALQITIGEFFGETGDDGCFMAAERVPYGAPLARNDTESSTIDALVRHVAWLEAEVDRLRNENAKRGK